MLSYSSGRFANGGGNYFSPEFAWASAGAGPPENVGFSNCTYNDGKCYSTSVIANQSIAWLEELKAQKAHKPFFAYIAVKAPHIQDGAGWPITLPAPWYNDTFPGLKAPRTPNWNASCLDHHWMIRTQPPMTDEQAFHSDALYRARWQSLLSVDDMVEGVVGQVEAMGEIHKTYFLFSSDHGYRFGQYRMPQGKWNSYDNDLRIPFVIRGPGIEPGVSFRQIASQVDTMPTILGLAGVPTPSTMDGRSIAHLLMTADNRTAIPAPVTELLNSEAGQASANIPWRTAQLVEYYGLGNVVRYEHLEDTDNNTFRTLRVIDPAAPDGEQNLKLSEFTGWANWDFLNAEDPENEFELFDLDKVCVSPFWLRAQHRT
jgi:N-acetylglucosamine-6-sulfatase